MAFWRAFLRNELAVQGVAKTKTSSCKMLGESVINLNLRGFSGRGKTLAGSLDVMSWPFCSVLFRRIPSTGRVGAVLRPKEDCGGRHPLQAWPRLD